MKKKFFAIYALTGALVASPIFTSCVDDTVSESVEALRNAKAEALKAEAAYKQALGDAELIKANAESALKNAEAALNNAKAALKEAEAKEKELKNQLSEATHDADLAAAVAAAEQARLEAENNLAIAQAKAESELEAAKLKAQEDLLIAQKTNMQAQLEYEKAMEGLDYDAKQKAEFYNKNVNAILKGGNYYAMTSYGYWSSLKYYSSDYYASNNYTSVNGLIAGIATEKINLTELKNGLVDLEEWLAEQKDANDEVIATNTALIEKYKELQTTSSREALTKEYEDAEAALEKSEDLFAEKTVELYKARTAVSNHIVVMSNDPIVRLIGDEPNYFTQKEDEILLDTVYCVDGVNFNVLTPYTIAGIYEHTAENADLLAAAVDGKKTAIDEKKADIASLEEKIASVNVDNLQRELAVEKAELAKIQKEYDDVLASEGYKAALKKLEDALAAAQAAFNANPTDIPEYHAQDENGVFLYEKNEDGTFKLDENGYQIPVMIQGTKQDLIDAEDALADFNYNYGTEAEPKYVNDLVDKLENNLMGTNVETGEDIYGYIDWVEYLQKGVEKGITDLEEDLEDLNEDLEELEEDLEELKGYQTMLAADSEEMKAYVALYEKYVELQKAYRAIYVENETLNFNNSYWTRLMGTLEGFIGNENGYEGSLPDYEALIEECEEAIKEAEEANAELAESGEKWIEQVRHRAPELDQNGDPILDQNGDIVYHEWYENVEHEGQNKAVQEAAIAKKEAEIAAMEAELEIRQAEYDAALAALKALIETAE